MFICRWVALTEQEVGPSVASGPMREIRVDVDAPLSTCVRLG